MAIDPLTTIVTGATTTAGVWVWSNYGKHFIDKLGESAKDKWEKFNWDKASEKYRKKVVYLYGTIRVLGNPKPVKLEGVFTDVFVLDKPTAFYQFSLQILERKFEKNRHLPFYGRRQNGLTLVSQPESHRLFILGKPGAGKTTFLKYIVLQVALGYINKIPIFISLKEWSDSNLDLLPFIVKQFEICSFPEAQPFIEYLLERGQAIVLFDGLDEINQQGGQRAKAVTSLSNFSKQYHTSQCLITCRIAATDYSFDHFTYVEVVDFTNEQIRAFVKKWFPDEEIQGKFFAELFNKENEGLQELGRIPLLLSLLCLAFDEVLTFPQRRVEVYEEAVDALLKKWDTSRRIKRDEIYRKLSLGRKRQMFARIAAETFEKGEYFLSQRDLEKQIVDYLQKLPPTDADEDIDGEGVLKAIEAQHGIFVERARRIYSFSHLSFQEYFTAKYIVDNAEKSTLKRLINNHLTNDRWREVFLLAASLLDDADGFFTLFRDAIDSLIKNDETLVVLLRWCEKNVATTETLFKPAVIRSIYCGYSVAFNLTSLLANVSDRTFDLTLSLEHTVDFDFERALDQAFDLERTLDRILEFTRTLSRTSLLARNLNPLQNLSGADFDCDLSHIIDHSQTNKLNQVLANARTLASSLTSTLEHVRPLTSNFDPDESRSRTLDHVLDRDFTLNNALNYARELVSNLESARTAANIVKNKLNPDRAHHKSISTQWNLTDEQNGQFRHYLEANILLVDCLKLAYVSDRDGIENNLLLPPKS